MAEENHDDALWQRAMDLSIELYKLSEPFADEPLPCRTADLQAVRERYLSSLSSYIRPGEIVAGTVIAVNRDEAYVDIGYKHEIVIPKRELAFPWPDSAEEVVKPGDKINVYVQALGGEYGGAFSKVKADCNLPWGELLEIMAHNGDPAVEELEVVDATISGVVKGGLIATVNGLRGFIPASQIELYFVKDLSTYVGQTLKVVPIEIVSYKRRLVLSRRRILEGAVRHEVDPAVAEQLHRVAVAIPAKISEGQRFSSSSNEFVAFLETARSLVIELETQLQLWRRLNCFSDTQTEVALNLCQEVGEMLNSQVTTLQCAQSHEDIRMMKRR